MCPAGLQAAADRLRGVRPVRGGHRVFAGGGRRQRGGSRQSARLDTGTGRLASVNRHRSPVDGVSQCGFQTTYGRLET